MSQNRLRQIYKTKINNLKVMLRSALRNGSQTEKIYTQSSNSLLPQWSKPDFGILTTISLIEYYFNSINNEHSSLILLSLIPFPFTQNALLLSEVGEEEGSGDEARFI